MKPLPEVPNDGLEGGLGHRFNVEAAGNVRLQTTLKNL